MACASNTFQIVYHVPEIQCVRAAAWTSCTSIGRWQVRIKLDVAQARKICKHLDTEKGIETSLALLGEAKESETKEGEKDEGDTEEKESKACTTRPLSLHDILPRCPHCIRAPSTLYASWAIAGCRRRGSRGGS